MFLLLRKLLIPSKRLMEAVEFEVQMLDLPVGVLMLLRGLPMQYFSKVALLFFLLFAVVIEFPQPLEFLPAPECLLLGGLAVPADTGCQGQFPPKLLVLSSLSGQLLLDLQFLSPGFIALRCQPATVLELAPALLVLGGQHCEVVGERLGMPLFLAYFQLEAGYYGVQVPVLLTEVRYVLL
jgi:hypothetical protein